MITIASLIPVLLSQALATALPAGGVLLPVGTMATPASDAAEYFESSRMPRR